jgi:hypothetical protein
VQSFVGAMSQRRREEAQSEARETSQKIAEVQEPHIARPAGSH